MNQSVKARDMRSLMPQTAAWIERKRLELGREHVNQCLRDALAGEPGRFYAMESGHVLGTPFPATHPVSEWQSFAIVNDTTFAAFIAEPGAVHTCAPAQA